MDTLLQRWIDMVGGKERLDHPLGDGIFPSAREYFEAGITPEEYRVWYRVRGWDIQSMLELVDAGISLDALGERTTKGLGAYKDTIAYKFCNGDLTFDQVLVLI